MTNLYIETYINNLEENADTINVSCVSSNPLNYLPQVTRFKHLRILNCSNNQLTFLPTLNENLQELYCYNNRLISLPTLNENLQILNCGNNQLTELPTLNENLQQLYCDNNQLTELPSLNENLQTLSCNNNQLTELPTLNENLHVLFCDNNQLELLPSLNVNLRKLHCQHNQLASLPTLNANLQELYYNNNPIYEIIDSNYLFIINNKLQILHKFCNLYYCLKFKTQFRDFLWKKIREPKIMKKYHPSYLNKLLIDDAEGTEDIDMVLDSWI